MRILEISGNCCVRWEVGENRTFDIKYSSVLKEVVSEVERGFGDGSIHSMVPNSGHEELHSASKVFHLVFFVNL